MPSACSRSTSPRTSGSASAAALAAGAAAGALVSLFISHRRGIYYAFMTIAFGQIFWFIAVKSHGITGGEDGLLKIARPPADLGLAAFDLTSNTALYYFVLVVFMAAVVGLWRLTHSPFGRVLSAIRQSETRAAHLGYRVRLYKMAVFTLSAALSGLAGGLFAMAQNSAFPDVMSLHYSGIIVMMVLIGGGMVSFWGPVVGVVVFSSRATCIGAVTNSWMLWFGLLFIAVVLFKPEGIAGAVRLVETPRPIVGAARPPRAGAEGLGAMAMLEARDIHVRFGDRVVLEDIYACGRAGRAARHHGPERRRQDHLLQRPDRAREARPRHGAHRRRGRHRLGAARRSRARARALVPDHDAVRRVHGARERR